MEIYNGFLIVISLFYNLSVGAELVSPVESITISADLTGVRGCVSTCADILPGNIGCSINSCLCRPDLRATANSWLSSCIVGPWSCPDSSDVAAGTSVLSSYCANYFAAVGATPASASAATTSASTGGGAASPQQTLGVASSATSPTSKPTSTSGSPNSNNGDGSSSGGLSPGIDTGIAIASLAVAILTLWVGWKTYKWMKGSSA